MIPEVFGGMRVSEFRDTDALLRTFWKSMTPQTYFDIQGNDHERIDLRLVEKIEALLVPKLGPWERSNRWWHQMDCDGNGVRQLMFDKAVFQFRILPELHNLLAGEHSCFGILCSVYSNFASPNAEPAELVAGVLPQKLMVAGNVPLLRNADA